MSSITIDGKEYDADSLSDEAKSQVVHIQYCDQKIAELDLTQATLKTARLAYSRKLSSLLPDQ